MAKTIKFYSRKELAALKPFITKKAKLTKESLDAFCSEFGRKPSAVRAIVFYKRKTSGLSVKRVSKPTTAKVTKNEFVIPISKWEIRNDNGTNSLVLHFSK